MDGRIRSNHSMRAGLGILAGVAAAILANVALFRACGHEPCTAGAAQVLPSLAAGLVAGLFIAASRRLLLLAVVVSFVIASAGAPLWSQRPVTSAMQWFPGDFVLAIVHGPARGIVRVVLNPDQLFTALIWWFLALWPLIAATMIGAGVARMRPSRQDAHRLYAFAAVALLLAALLAEWANAPRAWSPGVHASIAALPLTPHAAATNIGRYAAPARRQLTYRVPVSVQPDQVLRFHAGELPAWTMVDGSPLDAVWIDPSRSRRSE
jgi:hypothetical protein